MRRHLWHLGVFAWAVVLLAMVVLMRRSYRTPDQFTFTTGEAMYGVEFQRGLVCVCRLPPFFTGYRRAFDWVTFASPVQSSLTPAWFGSVDGHSVTLPVGGLMGIGAGVVVLVMLARRWRGGRRVGFEVGGTGAGDMPHGSEQGGVGSMMRQTKRLILRVGCLISVALCAVLVLQMAEVAPPFGLSWGDAVKARGYDAGFNGGILVRTASGMRAPPPGKYPYGVQPLGRFDVLGVHYHGWNMTADRTPAPVILGTFGEVRISLVWLVLLSLVLALRRVGSLVRERRIVRDGHYCRKCGYDLRATPARCPECGLVPAAGAAGVGI